MTKKTKARPAKKTTAAGRRAKVAKATGKKWPKRVDARATIIGADFRAAHAGSLHGKMSPNALLNVSLASQVTGIEEMTLRRAAIVGELVTVPFLRKTGKKSNGSGFLITAHDLREFRDLFIRRHLGFVAGSRSDRLVRRVKKLKF